MTASAEAVVQRLAADLARVFGGQLLTLAAFGSWVSGDFCPGRSDVDLLAVLGREPTDDDLAALRAVHDAVERDHPEWAGHVEVGYVSVASLVAVGRGETPSTVLLRISPGEALHAIPVSRHHVLDWDAARRADRPVVGDAPTAVMPALSDHLVAAVLRDHLTSWPEWVTESERVGFRAYAVLSVARSAVRLRTARPVSKREGARELARLRPEWTGLLGWAENWWYAGGSDTERAPAEVESFVRDLAGSGQDNR